MAATQTLATNGGIVLVALAIEWCFGWPDAVHRRIGHPVTWLGGLIRALDRTLNRERDPPRLRYLAGAVTSLACIGIAIGGALMVVWVVHALPVVLGAGSATLPFTEVVQLLLCAAVASTLLAARNLHSHVLRVHAPLAVGDLPGARASVAHIVGRDVRALDAPAVARAAVESLAENTSDGVVAPVCFALAGGLPGLAAYKAINTLDSMLGHRSARHARFGGFAARLDDLANWVPARLTALLFALATPACARAAFATAVRDAGSHRSVNAGWPEAAMAGVLGVRLSGPRHYDAEGAAPEPWLNVEGRDPVAADVLAALATYQRSLALMACLVALLLLSTAVSGAYPP